MTAPESDDGDHRGPGRAGAAAGLGTWQIEGPDATEAVRDAGEIGYRQIDPDFAPAWDR